MKKTIMLFCLTCFFCSLFGQEVLVLTKKENGKEKIIKQGKKIKIFTNTGSVYSDFFILKNDSIIISEKKFAINDIEMIGYKSTEMDVLGGVLTVSGGVVTILSSIVTIGFAQAGWYGLKLSPFTILASFVAISTTTAGILKFAHEPYFKKTKWKYSTRNYFATNWYFKALDNIRIKKYHLNHLKKILKIMKNIILLFCIICFCSNLFGQEVLVFKNKKNGQEEIINQNEKIRIKTNSGNVYRGYFILKNDTITLLGEGKISIYNVKKIDKCQSGFKSLTATFALSTGASTLLLSSIGMQIIAESVKMELLSILLNPVIILPAFLTITGIIMLTPGPHYKKDKWNYSVSNVE